MLRLFSTMRMETIGHLMMSRIDDAAVQSLIFNMIKDKIVVDFTQQNLVTGKSIYYF